MLDVFRTLFRHQYEAGLSMLKACIDRCPDTTWNAPVANHRFCQVVFHTLYFTDLYLGTDDEASFRWQPFHLQLAPLFADLPANHGQVDQRGETSEYAAGRSATYPSESRSSWGREGRTRTRPARVALDRSPQR